MDLIELVKLGKQIVGKKSFSNWNSATCDSKLLCRQGKILNSVVSDQDCNIVLEKGTKSSANIYTIGCILMGRGALYWPVL